MEVKWVPLLPLSVDCGGRWTCELQNDGVEVQGMWRGDGLALCRRLGGLSQHPHGYPQGRILSASLPHSNKGMEHLLSMKCKNVVPVYDLLLEMLNAHTLRGYKSSVAGSDCSSAEDSKSKEGPQNPQSQ